MHTIITIDDVSDLLHHHRQWHILCCICTYTRTTCICTAHMRIWVQCKDDMQHIDSIVQTITRSCIITCMCSMPLYLIIIKVRRCYDIILFINILFCTWIRYDYTSSCIPRGTHHELRQPLFFCVDVRHQTSTNHTSIHMITYIHTYIHAFTTHIHAHTHTHTHTHINELILEYCVDIDQCTVCWLSMLYQICCSDSTVYLFTESREA
jgi:hypothetical protein